jgi:hypothetical protein
MIHSFDTENHCISLQQECYKNDKLVSGVRFAVTLAIVWWLGVGVRRAPRDVMGSDAIFLVGPKPRNHCPVSRGGGWFTRPVPD